MKTVFRQAARRAEKLRTLLEKVERQQEISEAVRDVARKAEDQELVRESDTSLDNLKTIALTTPLIFLN